MTIPNLSDAPRKIVYLGSNSMGPFTFDFRVFAEDDVTVTRLDADDAEMLLVRGVGYTLTLVGSGLSGGSIMLSQSLNSGERLAIVGAMPISQPVRYSNQGAFYPETHERSFDRLTICMQEVQEALDRAVKISPADVTGTSTTLPVATLRANKAVVFDANGNVTVSGVDYDDSSLGAADAAAGFRDEAEGFRNEAEGFKITAAAASVSATASAAAAATYGQYGSIYLSNNFV